MAIGELTDFGYILFYLPYKRGEKNIILSTGNWYLDGVQSVNNWSEIKGDGIIYILFI